MKLWHKPSVGLCYSIIALSSLFACAPLSVLHKTSLACERGVLSTEDCQSLQQGYAALNEALGIWQSTRGEPVPTRLRAIEHLAPKLQSAEATAVRLYMEHQDALSPKERATLIWLQTKLDRAKDFGEIVESLVDMHRVLGR